MTETKTFKHPLGLTSAFEDTNRLMRTAQTPKYEIYTEASGYEEFPLAEWDIEVTFTKKRGPVESGQWREMGVIGEEVAVYVLAIYGSVAWVTDDPEDLEQGRTNAWTEPIASLR